MCNLLLVITMPYLVKDFMNTDVPTVDEHTSVIEAAKIIDKSSSGFILILRDCRPTGMVTEHDFVSKVIVGELNPSKITVGEIMSYPLITIDPDEDLLKAADLMQKHNIRRLPVVKEGIIYGVITAREIAQRCSEYVNTSIKDIMRWSLPFGV
jgi:CBS domain-containing protein